MKILHLLGEVRLPRDPSQEPASGIVRTALEIARLQASDGYQVTVATAGAVPWTSSWEGVELLTLPWWSWAKISVLGRQLDFRLHGAYASRTRTKKYDVIHAHDYAYFRALRSQWKIMHFHSDPMYRGVDSSHGAWQPRDFETVKRAASVVIAPSQFMKRRLEGAFGEWGGIHVVPNGVDLQIFNPERWSASRASLRSKWGVPETSILFFYCGAINALKGVSELTEAFCEVARRNSSVHLVLAGSSTLWGGKEGESAYEEHIKHMLEPLYHQGRVRFLGLLPQSSIAEAFQACDVAVVPSKTESFGISALEAQASGRPVIASRAGALPELVDEMNGVLVDPGDVKQLAAAMDDLARNPLKRQWLGTNATKATQAKTWHETYRRVREVYATLSTIDSHGRILWSKQG